MALVITKKVRTILLIVLTVLVVGAGGFLIWRVTQEESVAPEDSEAAPSTNIGPISNLSCDGILVDVGDVTHLRYPTYKYGQFVCGIDCMSKVKEGEYSDEEVCPPTRTFSIDSELPSDFVEGVYSITGLVGRGHYIPQGQTNEKFKITISNLPNDSPIVSTASNTQLIKSEGTGEYWEGSSPLGEFHLLENSNTVKMSHQYTCLNDLTAESVHLYRLCLVQENICEGGDWEDRPSGDIPYGTELHPIIIHTDDSDGLGAVTVKVNGNSVPSCEGLQGATCYEEDGKDIKIYIVPGQQYIPSGNYGMTVTWEDGKGIGGANCIKSTTFTVLEEEEVINPACSARAKEYAYSDTEWTPAEVGFCKVGSTATPNYDTLNNSFPEPGETVTWVCTSNADKNDFVNCEASRLNIDDVSCGTLVGNYSAETVEWPSGSFCSIGDPEPASPAFPSQGGQTTWVCANEDDRASCVATRDSTKDEPVVTQDDPVIPQTGIFDTVLGRVSVGVSFIFLGGLVSQYSKFNYLLNSISERHQFRSEIKKQRKAKRRREKLEENFD